MKTRILYYGLFGVTFEDNGLYVVGGRLKPSVVSLPWPHLAPHTARSIFGLISLCLNLS